MMKLIIYSRSNEREFGDHDKKRRKYVALQKNYHITQTFAKHLPHVFKRYLDLSVFNVIQTMLSIYRTKYQRKSSTINGRNR